MNKFTALFLLTALLATCGSPAAPPSLSNYTPPPSVELVINVLAPADTPAGESIVLNILDDLTGLSLNTQQLTMQPNGENSFTARVSVPPGTLLKYRYTRQSSAGRVEEAGAGGEPIASRSFLVSGAGHVAYDLITAWVDLPSNPATGQVKGLVAAPDGAPLEGVLVSASGIAATTDAEGRFQIAGLTQGLHNMVFSDPQGRYLSFQQGALVAAGSETPAAVQLSAAGTAQVTFILSTAETSPRGIPVYLLGNVGELAGSTALTPHDAGYTITLQLPTGVDLRYKYSLGDGFWNAEHYADGGFVVRQMVIPANITELTIHDNIAAWTAGTTAPIWFDLAAPDTGGVAYLQFRLLDWTTPLPMWNLGGGAHAYVLYSPTNFAEPLEYRYCRDAACTLLEANAPVRTVTGNQPAMQQIQDNIAAWQ